MPAQLLGQVKEEKEAEELEFTTAYMILVTKDGHYVLELDINKPVVISRPPTPSEIKGSLAVIAQVIQSQETSLMSAQHTVNAQMQLARQVQEQAQNQAILHQMGNPPR